MTPDAALDALYATLPTVACQGRCQSACSLIPMSDREAARLTAATLAPPGYHVATKTCRYLTPAGRCNVYAVRPLICRLYGVVETMPCPHGCQPDRWLTHDEGHAYIRQARALSQQAPDVWPIPLAGV